jgi:hypothetical protein
MCQPCVALNYLFMKQFILCFVLHKAMSRINNTFIGRDLFD